MELKDTVKGMISTDFKERLKAEYQQIHLRLIGLSRYLLKDDVVDRELLEQQRDYMLGYRNILVVRASHLGINLESEVNNEN